MTRRLAILFCGLLGLGVSKALAQQDAPFIRTFGYFQTAFQHQQSSEERGTDNSFSIQQLNLFFQTDFSPRWRAFVSFEVLNNFSSSRRWGSFDLDEAWVSYRESERLTLKAGLHVPVFNHLNEIKNRTPLLPYVIRPLVYEESFAEFIAVEDFVPDRAFAQAHGFLSMGRARLDYAAYLGNSPNVNSQFDNERLGQLRQTGVDTTTTVLVGGRLGFRYGFDTLKLGVSATREVVNTFATLADSLGGKAPFLAGAVRSDLEGVPKMRLGADLSVRLGDAFFEGEFIAVRHDVDPPPALAFAGEVPPRINLDRTFYYGTLGYHVGERLLVYGGYWFTDQAFEVRALNRDGREAIDIEVVTAGGRYVLLYDADGFERITLKAQYGHVRIENTQRLVDQRFNLDQDHTLDIFAVAVSVLF